MTSPRQATYARHYAEPPQATEPDGSPTWITRGARFVVAVTRGKAGTTLHRIGQPDEFMLVLPPGAGARVTARGETVAVEGDSLTILPPGDSEIVLDGPALAARVLTERALDLAALAVNAADYADGAPEVRPLALWPEPVGGYRIRSYRLADHIEPGGPMIQPIIFRSTNIMINVFAPWNALRDNTRLSPHWHDDFEQASLTLEGAFTHYIRTPWSSDMTRMRPDEAVEIDSPSTTIIPATLVHTTTNRSAETARLIDIFAPPRFDFSNRPGMVRNADDYPMPEWAIGKDDAPKGSLQGWQSGKA